MIESLEAAIERIKAMTDECRRFRWRLYRMEWPKGHSEAPPPPKDLREYAKANGLDT